MRFRFGEFTLDLDRHELRREDKVVHLRPKPMQMLKILIENRPNVVSHQDLYDQLWPDVVVQLVNLNNLAADLRRSLDDHQRKGRFLRTVHGRGYAFTDEVIEISRDEETPVGMVVILYHRGRRINLGSGENVIGRGEDSDVVIDDPEVSRHHAKIVLGTDRTTIVDLGSKNGTFVGAVRIESAAELEDGDEIRLGAVHLTVKVVSRADVTKTTPRDN